MMRRIGHKAFLAAAALLLGGALSDCASQQPEAVIVVPSSATSAPDYAGDGSVPRQRYVVRMSDGQRDWEVEFPETASGYEMRIPLKGAGASADDDKQRALLPASDGLTEADKELLARLRRENPDIERDGVYAGGENVLDEGLPEPGAELDEEGNPVVQRPERAEDAPSPTRPSYLLGIEEVKRLFRGGNYELALIKLRELENAYPNDVQILSMKGSLWERLGRPGLAREAWEQVLQIQPDNRVVVRALRRLEGAEAGAPAGSVGAEPAPAPQGGGAGTR